MKKYDAIIMVDGKYMAANTNAGVRLLLAFLGGFICGLGNALCLTSGGSSGGIDVIANTLLVKRSISLTKFFAPFPTKILYLSSSIDGNPYLFNALLAKYAIEDIVFKSVPSKSKIHALYIDTSF